MPRQKPNPILSSQEVSRSEMMIYQTIAKAKVAEARPTAGGTIPCPACGGELHYKTSQIDGQSKAQCKTDHCLYW